MRLLETLENTVREYKKTPLLIGLSIFVIYPIFALKTQLLLFAIFGAFVIYSWFKQSICFSRVSLKKLIYLASPFLIIVLGLLLSDNLAEGLKEVERSLTIILIPIAFFIINAKYKVSDLKSVNNIFSIALSALLAYTILNIIFTGLRFEVYNSSAPLYYVIREDFSYYTKTHPVYLNFMIFLTVTIKSYFITRVYNRDRTYDISNILHVFALTIVGLVIATRTPILAYLLILGIIILYQLQLSTKKKILLSVIGVTILSILAFNIPSIKSRLVESTTVNAVKKNNGTNERINVLNCSKEVISQNWLMGVGTGDSQTSLVSCYSTYDYSTALRKKLNTHNQYLCNLLRNGVLGLFSLFPLFIFLLKKGSKKDLLPFYMALFFGICFLTENLLSRQIGIITVYFFSCFIIFSKKEYEG